MWPLVYFYLHCSKVILLFTTDFLLLVKSRDGDGQSFEADWRFLNALWTDGMCANLQTVEMSSIIWLPNEISFMKLVLSKARRLRTLSVDSHPDDFDDPIIDLLNYKRASPQTRVLFEGKKNLIMGFSVSYWDMLLSFHIKVFFGDLRGFEE